MFVLLGVPCFLGAEERQAHGLDFERRVWSHMFDQSYGADWDIPGGANLHNPGVPISLKYIRWGASVYLGDALRQRTIDEPFEMIVGFYEPEDRGRRTVALHHLAFDPESWNDLWGGITAGELEAFGERIKEGTLEEARAYARGEAARLREKSKVFSINPKIDGSQRRIQCSIPFTVFYRQLVGAEPAQQENPELWGRPWQTNPGGG
ncbi:MAG: hypothetical protein ACLFRP_00300 [Puniceicoccaceae bacterium]